ncbi:hypothetical protein HER10_EVM0009053 [Colletotrichum scovillei]|uniref:uncharacterized protein n=1 Tax=Colletotrichum scovillei TaxID=1209932 RepID=UPI0015C36A2B|nr:uncharacterized protein HER10_EVM0009053 [Colletotrichum scovillei]KAF4772737.1 hypothetical protein HER10_EVM0009053 [Colletotrichum scovillei]
MAFSDSPSDFDWDTWSDNESIHGSSSAPAVSSRAASQQPPGGRLPLLRLIDWDRFRSYDEQPPTCIHYSLEWKLTANNRTVSKDSEPNLVLAPGDFWDMTLQSKLSNLVTKKLAANKLFKPDDTTVIVSVRDRSEEDLVKRFDDLEIEWEVVETQLRTWSHLFRAGKKLKISVSFNYVETGPRPCRTTGTKRSATQRMLAERDAELEGERNRTGQAPSWERVYSLMRCPGPPCNLGPHCWVDDNGGKHHKLMTRHLTSLVAYVEDGGMLESHSDIPSSIRELLYAEDQQRLDRQGRSQSQAKYPPINITNVMPGSDASAGVSLSGHGPGPAPTSASPQTPTRLKISGPRDSALRSYYQWQCAQVLDNSFKAGYRKAYEVMVEHCLDLEQVDEDQDTQFFIDNGVKKGAAARFIRDIREWALGQESEQQ